MHVHHVMASGARGGGADHLLGLLPALAAAGTQVSATVGDDGPLAERLRARGVAATAMELLQHRVHPPTGQRLYAAAQVHGAQLVHAHGTRAAALLASASGLWPWGGGEEAPLPTAYTAHGLALRVERAPWLQPLAAQGEAFACRRKVAVLSVSRADLALLVRRGWVPAANAHYVGNAVAPARFAAAAREREALAFRFRAHHDVPPSAPLVGTVSRLVRQKDVFTLARAVGRLPGVHLAVVGDGPDYLRLRAHPLARAGRMHLLGPRDDVPELLVAFDVFALASRWEGEPIALLEAMAAGVPWVATATAGAEEIWHDSEGGGVLVPIGEPRPLAEGIARLLRDRHEAARLATLGRRAVAGRSPQAQARAVRRIYAALAPSAGP